MGTRAALALVAMALVGAGTSALLALEVLLETVLSPPIALPQHGPGPVFDLCARPLTGFWLFWHDHGAWALGVLAVVCALATAVLPLTLLRDRRRLAVAACVVIALVAPLPWVVYHSHVSFPGCHQL